MEHETGSPDVVEQGSPDRSAGGPPRGRRGAQVATAVAVAAVAGSAAWAAAGPASADPLAAAAPAPSPSTGTTAPPEPGDSGRHLGHGPRLGLGSRGALHGELVVPDGEGYRQVALQRGTVTAVSATSLTVKSEDDFSRTYVLNGDTVVDGTKGAVKTLANGDTVRVLADLKGSTATATRVNERDPAADASRPGRHPHWGGHPGNGNGDDNDNGNGNGKDQGNGEDDGTGGGSTPTPAPSGSATPEGSSGGLPGSGSTTAA